MALTPIARSSSESIRVPSRSKTMSLIFSSGSGRNVRIIPFQYSDVTFFWTCHDGPSEASALFFGAKAKKSPLVVAGQFPSTRRSGSYHVIGSNRNGECGHFRGKSVTGRGDQEPEPGAGPIAGHLDGSLSLQSSIEEVNVVPSILLNPIHCCVCTLDQSPPIGTVLWKDADAYAGGNMKNVRCEVMWGRECSENLFGDWHQVS